MNPQISIIIPVYNAEKYLHRCVDSILSQTYTDFEVLLIDDGSPDKSGEICEEYAKNDSRIHVVHKDNGGVSAARNLALDISKGEYIIFLDSDDWLDSKCLEICFNKFNTYCLDAIQFGFTYVYDTYSQIKVKASTGILDGESYVAGNSLNVSAGGGIYRKSIIDEHQIRFNTKLIMAEDQLFVYNFMKHANKVVYLDLPLYYYYQNTNGAVRRRSTPDLLQSCHYLIEMTDKWLVTKTHIDTMVVALLIKIICNKPNKEELNYIKHLYYKLTPRLSNLSLRSCYFFCILSKINISLPIFILKFTTQLKNRN